MEIHKEQIKSLLFKTWKNKRFSLFVFRDFAFLAALYGLSGAKGTCCCLWCHIQQKELQVPLSHRGLSSLRKLKNMNKHHKDFKTKGKGKLSAASSYKYCIHEPLLDINISHVCPPYLHILLGIVKKHNDLLEERVHQVEEEIAEEISLSRAKLRNTLFHNHIEDLRKFRKNLNRLGFLKAEREEDADLTERERTKMNKDIASLEAVVKSGKPKLNNQNGPLVQALEKALKRHKIVKQSYHSRSFVGNHQDVSTRWHQCYITGNNL